MQIKTSILLRVILVVSMQNLKVLSEVSRLKVAVCNPGSIPYSVTDANGTSYGFDIGRHCFPFFYHELTYARNSKNFVQICGMKFTPECLPR